MQVLRVNGETDAEMGSYCVDKCRYGQLLQKLMQVWTVTGETDADMECYWID